MSPTSNIVVHFTSQSLKHIKASKEPTVTVDLEYIKGCPMQCCDASNAKAQPTVNLAKPRNQDVGFIIIETVEGIPVYLSKLFLERIRDKKELTIDVKGSWKKRFLVKELGEGPLLGERCRPSDTPKPTKQFQKYNYSQVFKDSSSKENSR